MVTNDMPAATRAIVARYRDVWREAQGAAAPLPKMGMVRFIVVADTDAAALATARRAYLRWRHSFTYLHDMHGTQVGSPLRAESFDALVKQGQAIAGSPQTVTAFLNRSSRTAGATMWSGRWRSAISRSAKCCARSSCSAAR